MQSLSLRWGLQQFENFGHYSVEVNSSLDICSLYAHQSTLTTQVLEPLQRLLRALTACFFRAWGENGTNQAGERPKRPESEKVNTLQGKCSPCAPKGWG